MKHDIMADVDELTEIVRKYRSDFSQRIEEIRSTVQYEQYGVGGETIHRGYYCPSKIFDVVTGNAKRGRIAKRASTKRRAAYVYGFNHQDELVMVNAGNEEEFIIRENQTEMGFGTFVDNQEIHTISRCQYDGDKILSYEFGLYMSDDDQVYELTQEKYTYFSDRLVVDWYSVLTGPWKPLLTAKSLTGCVPQTLIP